MNNLELLKKLREFVAKLQNLPMDDPAIIDIAETTSFAELGIAQEDWEVFLEDLGFEENEMPIFSGGPGTPAQKEWTGSLSIVLDLRLLLEKREREETERSRRPSFAGALDAEVAHLMDHGL